LLIKKRIIFNIIVICLIIIIFLFIFTYNIVNVSNDIKITNHGIWDKREIEVFESFKQINKNNITDERVLIIEKFDRKKTDVLGLYREYYHGDTNGVIQVNANQSFNNFQYYHSDAFEINNSLKVIYIDQGASGGDMDITMDGGRAISYYSLPVQIKTDHYNIQIDERFNITVNGNILYQNSSIEIKKTENYQMYRYNPNSLCLYEIMYLIPSIFILVILNKKIIK